MGQSLHRIVVDSVGQLPALGFDLADYQIRSPNVLGPGDSRPIGRKPGALAGSAHRSSVGSIETIP